MSTYEQESGKGEKEKHVPSHPDVSKYASIWCSVETGYSGGV